MSLLVWSIEKNLQTLKQKLCQYGASTHTCTYTEKTQAVRWVILIRVKQSSGIQICWIMGLVGGWEVEGFDYHKSCESVCSCVPLSVHVLTAKPDFPTIGCTGSAVRGTRGWDSKNVDAVTLPKKYIKNWCEEKSGAKERKKKANQHDPLLVHIYIHTWAMFWLYVYILFL